MITSDFADLLLRAPPAATLDQLALILADFEKLALGKEPRFDLNLLVRIVLESFRRFANC